MEKSKIAQTIAVLDIVFGTFVFFYLCVLFSQGIALIPGPLSDVEKMTRLVAYGIFTYTLALTHIWMAIRLLLTAKEIKTDEAGQVKSNIQFRPWLEWSMIHLLILILYFGVMCLLMEFSQRKLFSLATLGSQLIFRLVGIIVISRIDIEPLLLEEITNI